MKKRRLRLYYTGGMISLVLLPIMIYVWNLYRQTLNDSRACLEVVYEDKPEIMNGEIVKIQDSGTPRVWYWKNRNSPLPKRQYLNFNISAGDNFPFLYSWAKNELTKMIQTNDTTKGVHFHFDKKSKYYAFVEVNSLLFETKVKGQVWSGNDIWVYNNVYHRKKIPEDSNGIRIIGGMGRDCYPDESYLIQQQRLKEKEMNENIKTHLSANLNIFIPVIILFVMLLGLSIFNLKKYI